jgi:hypothetical protein
MLPAVLTAARSYHGRILVLDGQRLLSQLLPSETTAAVPMLKIVQGHFLVGFVALSAKKALT